MSLIECENLKLCYENNVVLSGLDFSVGKGDYLCIVGENGSGKSTLVKTLLGLKSPAEGSIRFSDGLKRGDIGYLPQRTELQKDFPATVGEIVMSGTLSAKGLFSFYTKEDRKKAETNMEKLSILDLKDKSFRELSGGQQQRALLARALCAADKLLLLDEPVAGLDPLASSDMYKVIKDLNDNGTTVIMVSHDISSSLRYATHILHLHKISGFFGTTEEYKKSNPFWRMRK